MWTLTTARHLVRKAADGGRICRVTWWTGNPSVNEGIPGVKFDLSTTRN